MRLLEAFGPVLGSGGFEITVGQAEASRAEELKLAPDSPILAVTKTLEHQGWPVYLAKHLLSPRAGHLLVAHAAQAPGAGR